MFNVGDRVRTLAVETRTDHANSIYAGKTGIITEISFPVGIAACYKVEFDEPFYDFGYVVRYVFYYDFENGLEKIV